MIRLFLENRIGVLLLLPVIITIYFLLNYQTGYYLPSVEVNLGLWNIKILDVTIFSLISAFLIFVNAVGLNILININEFFEKNAYIVSLLYVVTMSFYHSFYSLNGSLIAHSFLILMLYQFFKLKQNVDGRAHVFNGALFAGIAATFFPPLLISLPFIITMVLIIRPFYLREMLLCIFGFVTPVFFALVYVWNYNSVIDWMILDDKSNTQLQTDFIVSMVVFAVLLTLSIFSLSARLQKSSIRFKKQIQIIWVLIVLAIFLGVVDFLFFKQIERFSLLMIPLSILLSYSFYHKNYGIVSTVIFYLTMLYSVLKFFIFSPHHSL
jgi:hypothetical protein